MKTMNKQLIDFGFELIKCPFTGRDCWVYETYRVLHMDQIGDRFAYYPETKMIRDFKLMLPPKIVNNFTDIKNYVKHSKYYD